jgi:diguanylate cyclase (GGDEF)-like protein
MSSRYGSLAVYSMLVAAAAGIWLGVDLAAVGHVPPLWALTLCVGASLFVWHFGLTAPRVVLTSMERLPQIGALLVFEPAIAAAACALASLVWPFVSRAYSYGSIKVAALRGVHNAGMTALMLLIAGKAYLAAGGHHPLDTVSLQSIWPLAAMALAAQGVNVAAMALFYFFDGRDVRRLIRPVYSLIDLMFVPAGILAAVLANASTGAAFVLFAGLMVIFVVSFNGIGTTLNQAESESGLLARLSRARRALHGVRRIDALGERILTETRNLFRLDEFHLVLVDPERQEMNIRVHERYGKRQPALRKPLHAGLFGWVIAQGQAMLIESWNQAPEPARQRADASDKDNASLLLAPLIEEGAVIGLLSVQQTRAGAYSKADLHLIQHLAEQVSGAVADARVFEELESYRQTLERRVVERTRELEQANHDKERLINALDARSRTLERESQEDALTGIANRRCFDQTLAAEIAASRATGRPLTLGVADLDHFKMVNDRLGHSVGDEVLKQAAQIMRRRCAASDLVARIGGEEFALLLPGVTNELAMSYCDMVRRAFESHDWSAVHPNLHVTMSIGISQWDGTSAPTAFLNAADAQLYLAKNAGRNRVA